MSGGTPASPHAAIESALGALLETLEYVPINMSRSADRRGPVNLRIEDIYVALRSDVVVDVKVEEARVVRIAAHQSVRHAGTCVESDQGAVPSPLTSNVDPDLLVSLLNDTQAEVRGEPTRGLSLPTQPVILAPFWMDGERINAAALEAALAVHLYRKCVLLGPPGSGKSTLAKMVALDHLTPQTGTANERRMGLPLWAGVPLTPIYIELRHFVAHPIFPQVGRPATAEHLLAYLRDVFGQSDGVLAEHFAATLSNGSAYLILDGLDEVPIPNNVPDALEMRREQLISFVGSVSARYPRVRVLVTSRPAGYSGWTLPGFDEIYLLPLSSSEARSLARALYRGFGHDDEWASERASALEQELPSIPRSLREQAVVRVAASSIIRIWGV